MENENFSKMSQTDRCELFGSLIDVVEDWLESKGIIPADIPNGDRDEDAESGGDGENLAIIYGADYDELADRFSMVLGISRDVEESDNPQNTKISYLYRDASNYKNRNEAVISGPITEEQKNIIMDCLDGREFFIPSQVGLPEERFEDETEDDHCWFELDANSFSETDLKADVDLTVEQLVNNFVAAKGNWDDSQVFG